MNEEINERLKTKLRAALGGKTKEELELIHHQELKNEEKYYRKKYFVNTEKRHASFAKIPKFYSRLPAEHEILKLKLREVATLYIVLLNLNSRFRKHVRFFFKESRVS